MLIVTILANVICFGPMYNNLAPIINGGGSVSPESAAASEAVIEKVVDEGIVLAENNGVLPLSNTSKINVFGWAATNPIYGGTGSGSSSNEGNIDILTSLQNAGFEVNQEIIDMYREYSPNRTLGGNVVSVNFTDWSLPEPPVERYTDTLIDNAKAFSDTAVIVLSRSGGEGQDLPTNMSKVIDGTVDDVRQTLANSNEGYNYYAAAYTNNSETYDDFAPGESYLQLSRTERDMIDLVATNFDKVVVVVNANNAMELGFVNDYDSIGAVLLAPGTGRTAMNGLGKILKGTVNPSGRTVETYVYDQKATPAYNNYGSFTYDNVDDLLEQYTEYDPGFQGMVLTDWFGSYGYQVTTDSVLNGNDIMLGFGSNVRTEIENLDSPTMVKALRQAAKNIMFIIVRSGNYTVKQKSAGLDRMTAMFIGIDVGVGVVVAGIAAFLFLRYRKKNQQA